MYLGGVVRLDASTRGYTADLANSPCSGCGCARAQSRGPMLSEDERIRAMRGRASRWWNGRRRRIPCSTYCLYNTHHYWRSRRAVLPSGAHGIVSVEAFLGRICVAVGEDVSIELICEVLRPVYTSLCGKQDAVVHDSAVVSSSSGHVLRPARNPAMGAARGAWESDMTAHERSWIVLRVREASFSYVEDMHRLRYGHTLDWKEQEYERSSMDELADLLSCYCKSFFLTSLNHPPVLYVRRGNYAFISQP